MLKKICLISVAIIALINISSCDDLGTSVADIPAELNGDWNLSGLVQSTDGTMSYSVDQDIRIQSGKVYPKGGGEWQATYVNQYLNIYFEGVVQEGISAESGSFTTSLKVTAMFYIVTLENEYEGSPAGIFVVNSESKGVSYKELRGNFELKRF